MKYTLLDLTQTILSSMDSDEINSITDTPEAQQVVKVIRSSYFDIINRANLPEQYTLFSLEASLDNTKPVLMSLPTDIKNVSWVRYDNATLTDTAVDMVLVTKLPLEDFVSQMYQLRIGNSEIETFTQTVGTSQIQFIYRNDGPPTTYTSFDDNTVIFNSYDSTVDTTLQKSKTLAYGQKSIPWSDTDTFVPDLDEAQFALLLNEAKSLAFNELKQTSHAAADRNSRRGWVQLQHQKKKIPLLTDFNQLPDFSRKV